MKNKPAKMYILVLKEESITLLNANKFDKLVEFIPTEEALRLHIEIQKIELQKDNKYKPKPLYISIEKSIFNEIILEINGKNSSATNDHIPLVLQSTRIPICIIQSN